ncbi:putative membrane protein [Lysobacter antibioticus]|uniref:DUF2065 domain-containing protein n=1 Tax=Lysobacter antibioticus TaxID=84531 RepID=UPI0007171093|nr:DUF2065 family protein [Lysobacter antibioticus]ALN61721.1 putative membrane protein [Lysobacter antibioticus]
MVGELIRALCLVAVLEGLFLFVAPNGWKRAAEQLQALPDRHLRVVGGVVVAIGVVSLWVLRGG